MNKTILSKLTFSDIGNNTAVPSPYNDNNKYSTLIWSKGSTPTITVVDNKHMLNISNINYRLQSQSNYFSASSFIVNDFELDVNVRLSSINSMNGFYGVTLGTGNAWISYYIKNTFIGGITITSASGNELSFNYKFEKDVDYNIIISFIDYKYRLIINGEIIGYIEKSDFKEMLRNTNAGMSMFVLGSVSVTSNNANNLSTGQMWNINTSLGPGIKNEDASHLTKYGTNLLSRLNFDNLQSNSTSTVFTPNLESLFEPAVTWNYDSTKVNKYNVNTTFVANINYDYLTLLIDMNNTKNMQDVKLIEYGNYKVIYNFISVGEPEPVVIVDNNTTSALDFENGFVDKVSTTNWTQGNSAKVQDVNKIYGDYSLETKLNGDDIQSPAKLLTGNGTPYTVEYHFLYKGKWTPEPIWDAPIFTRYTAGDIGNYLNTSTYNISFHSVEMGLNNSSVIFGKSKLKPNEINKVTMSYDGSAIRMFINDKLDNTLGTNVGFITRGNQPYRFFSRFADDQYTNPFTSTFGLLDNINIFDGIAKTVRNKDINEDKLIVDLAFDGENNSTKIVDNGNEILRKNIPYNDNIVSLLHFETNFIDETGRLWSNTSFEFNTDSVFGGYSGNRNISSSSIYTSKTNDDFKWSTQNYTIEMFVKVISSTYTPTGSGRSDMICSSNDGHSIYDWGFGINERNKLSFAYWGGDQYLVESVNTFNDNNWHHIAMVNDGSTIKIFADGILEAQDTIKGTPSDSNVPIRIGAGNGFSNHKFLIDELCITKGIAKYKTNFNIPITQFQHIPKNKWTVNGSAKISTDQKFDGFSSLSILNSNDFISSSNSNFIFKNTENYTISFSIIRTNESKYDVILTSGDLNTVQNNISLIAINPSNHASSPNSLYLVGKVNIDGNRKRYTASTQILANKIYNISIVVNSGTLLIYVNGILTKSEPMLNDLDFTLDNTTLGYSAWDVPSSFTGYIKNFKIYKGVAVIPESPVGKIQLDFDNNLNDVYNNSTWTNNGVTFDQVNSVKGHAAYFNGDNKYITSGINDDLNYGTNDFSFEFDVKNTNVNKSKLEVVLCSGDTNIISSTTKLQAIGIHYQSNFNGYASQPNELKSLLIFGYFYNNIDYLQTFYVMRNVYYHYKQTRKGNALIQRVNDVITNASNYNLSLPININNNNNTVMGKCLWRGNDIGTNINSQFDGYIDNFKSIKDYKENVIIDKPAVHLPLETNSINIGFTQLDVNSVGNPTYTTIDGKKCIKFESGKYLSINSNNIFNLGTNSDFYMEFDFYPTTYRYQTFISDNVTDYIYSYSILSMSEPTYDNKIYFRNYVNNNTTLFFSDNAPILNSWNKLIFKRSGSNLQIILNDVITNFNTNIPINFSTNSTRIGAAGWAEGNYVDNLSNFKMFVGTSEIPESYNDKKVLDLDFKPTGKSYLFKDNNNKCVIHPVNITQRDYQDSQYCCTFNGTDQYLQLGKNDLLNFGFDDFVINIKFKITSYDIKDKVLLASGETSIIAGRTCIFINSSNANPASLSNKISMTVYTGSVYKTITLNNQIPLNEMCNLIIVKENNTLSLYLNDDFISDTVSYPYNFNLNNNTVIGALLVDNLNYCFKGTIYSIKVLRNTTDLSLLEDVSSQFEESFTLTNGNESDNKVILNTERKSNHNIRFVKDETNTSLIVDGEFVEVPTVENTSTELKLFDEYNSNVKDVKLYDTAFIDDDIFLGNEPIDTVFGEIEYNEESEYELDIPEGNYTLKGFIEGYTDRDFFIYNTVLDYEIYRGTEYYDVNFMDEYSLDDYEINDLVTGAKYQVLKHEMIRGFISGTVNLKGCGVAAKDMKVYCYRDDTHRLIGIYSVDETGKYNIPNLDVNSKYDIIFKDETRKIKDQISNYRTPKVY